jgi:D-alanyl-D-alanine dipeptidase
LSLNYKYLRRVLQPFVAAILLTSCSGSERIENNDTSAGIPDGFVDLAQIMPACQAAIHIELRYFSNNNFIGTVIDGYKAKKLYLSNEAAAQLLEVQRELVELGFSLKVFDAYRPQQAVDHFVRWARDLADVKNKQSYYPGVSKENLFRDGYISERSGHSRGSTVDLTLIDLGSGNELDMGTGYDYFDPLSWPSSDKVSAEQKNNRLLLQEVMRKHGFQPLIEEWWHFTLRDEPFPDTYFNFLII